MSPSTSSTRRNVVVTSFGNLLSPLSMVLVAPILASGLGVEGRGALAAATAPLVLAIAVAPLGLPESVTLQLSRHARLARRSTVAVASVAVASSALAAGMIWLLAPQLSGGNGDLSVLIRIAAIALAPAVAMAFLRAVAIAHGAWNRVAAEKAVGGATRLIGIGALSLAGSLTPTTATVVMSGSYFAGFLAYLGRARHQHADVGVPGTPRQVIGFGVLLWTGSLAGVVLGRVDQVLIVPLAGVAVLGIYVVAVNLSEVILIFNAAIRDVVFPLEARSTNAERLARASRVSTLATIAVSVPLALMSPWVVPALFGADFAQSVVPLLVLLIGLVVGNPGSVAGTGLTARSRPGVRSSLLLIAGAINVVLLYLLVPAYGALGAAIAAAVSNAFAGIGAVVALRLLFKEPMSDYLLLRRSDAALLFSFGVSVLGRIAGMSRK